MTPVAIDYPVHAPLDAPFSASNSDDDEAQTHHSFDLPDSMVQPRAAFPESSEVLYTGLNDICLELHHRICQYLPQNDIWNLSRCSRYMSESFPSSITVFRTRGHNVEMIASQLDALRRAPNLRELTIDSFRSGGRTWARSLVKNCPHLQRLRLSNCHITVLAYAAFGFLPSLTKMEAQSSQVDDFHLLFSPPVLAALTPAAHLSSSPSSSSVSSASSSSPLSEGTLSADSSCSDLSVGGGGSVGTNNCTPSTTPSPRSAPLSASTPSLGNFSGPYPSGNTAMGFSVLTSSGGGLSPSSTSGGFVLSTLPPPMQFPAGTPMLFSAAPTLTVMSSSAGGSGYAGGVPLPAPAPPTLFPVLESLTIVPTRTYELAIIVSHLTTLRKLNATLEAEEKPSKYLAPACVHLESLTLNTTYSDKTLPTTFIRTFRVLTQLRKLDLSTGVDDNNMRSICKKLTNLTSLHIRNAHNLGEIGLSEIRALPNLRTLFIDFSLRAISRSARHQQTGGASDLAWVLKFKSVVTLTSLTFLMPDSFALHYVHDTLRRSLPGLRRLQLGSLLWCG